MFIMLNNICRTQHLSGLKKLFDENKKNRFMTSCSFGGNVLVKESPLSIIVIRNPNWST
jgi:hypothetical protein